LPLSPDVSTARYVCNTVNQRRIIIIINAKVINADLGHRIGMSRASQCLRDVARVVPVVREYNIPTHSVLTLSALPWPRCCATGNPVNVSKDGKQDAAPQQDEPVDVKPVVADRPVSTRPYPSTSAAPHTSPANPYQRRRESFGQVAGDGPVSAYLALPNYAGVNAAAAAAAAAAAMGCGAVTPVL